MSDRYERYGPRTKEQMIAKVIKFLSNGEVEKFKKLYNQMTFDERDEIRLLLEDYGLVPRLEEYSKF